MSEDIFDIRHKQLLDQVNNGDITPAVYEAETRRNAKEKAAYYADLKKMFRLAKGGQAP